MPRYRPDMTDTALRDLLDDAPVTVVTLDDLSHLAARLPALDEWVHTMEVSELRDDRLIGRIDLAMMGLDGEDDWEVPLEPGRMRALLDTKIAAMRATGLRFSFEIYMGETA